MWKSKDAGNQGGRELLRIGKRDADHSHLCAGPQPQLLSSSKLLAKLIPQDLLHTLGSLSLATTKCVPARDVFSEPDENP